MLISDVIRVLGDSSLKEFPWGCVVKDTINLFAKNEFRLTDNSTGKDVLASLESLGDDVKELVLKASVDTARCSITQPVGGGMVVEHNGDPQSDPTVELWNAVVSPKFIVVASIVMAVIMITVNMLFRLPGHSGMSFAVLFDIFLKVATEE